MLKKVIGSILVATCFLCSTLSVHAASITSDLPHSASSANAGTFTNPLPDDGGSYADPWVTYVGGYYYYCGSDGASTIFLKKSSTLQEILTAPSHILYTAPSGQAYSKEVWAPELHFLNGNWYVYFAADDGSNLNHRMFCIEGGSDADNPLDGAYTFKAKLAAATDKWAIDGSPFVYHDQMYFVWSGWDNNTINTDQNLYIAAMSNPYTVSGDRIKISKPGQDWEKRGVLYHTNEGPEVLMHNDTLCIIYSADESWTDNYCLGQLKLTGSNLLDADSWTKSGPVFQKTSNVFGVGHSSFTKSPDGSQDWIVYHAEAASNSGWTRNIRTQQFTWNEDNTPNFGSPVSPGTELNPPSGSSDTGFQATYFASDASLHDCYTNKESHALTGIVAGHIDQADSYAEFQVDVPASGIYYITVRDDNGSSAVSTHNLYVNGVSSGTVSYPDKGWNNFTTTTVPVQLNEGSNSLRFVHGTNYAELDNIIVSSFYNATYVAANCAVMGDCYVNAERSASDGKVVGHIDNADSFAEFDNVYAPAAGTYFLTVRADNGSSGSSLSTQNLSVNDVSSGAVTYQNRGWNSFTDSTVQIQLNAGNNSIKLAHGTNYAELDSITVQQKVSPD